MIIIDRENLSWSGPDEYGCVLRTPDGTIWLKGYNEMMIFYISKPHKHPPFIDGQVWESDYKGLVDDK